MVRLFAMVVLGMVLAATAAWARPDNQQEGEGTAAAIPPSCGVLPDSPLRMRSAANHETPGFSYADDSEEQLKKAVPALRKIKFEMGETVSGGMDPAVSQDETASILGRTGEVIAAMLHRIPNLVAREAVTQAPILSPESSPTLPASGGRNRSAMQYSYTPIPEIRTNVFNYRIVSRQDGSAGDALDEYRTDAHNRPIDESVKGPDNRHSVGFGTTWLFFFPGNFQESHFRYLGRQKIGGHETYAMAFAQIPGRTHLLTLFDGDSGSCSTFVQGVAWIDQSTFQIVRMQTDLLSPLPSVKLKQLRSILTYGEVKIPGRSLLLWLPSDVEISWQMMGPVGEANQGGTESHRYSNYRLFAATATLLGTDGRPLP